MLLAHYNQMMNLPRAEHSRKAQASELYESFVETLEILRDRKFMALLRKGIREAAKGKGIPWEKAKKKLGI